MLQRAEFWRTQRPEYCSVPDIGMTQEWKEKCMQMRKRNIRTEISEYLEENANDVERVNGYDIADYLIKVKSGEAVLQSMTRKILL